MNKSFIFLFFLPIFLLGCEKGTSMDGGLERFVGTWTWEYTVWSNDQSSTYQLQYMYASETSETYKIEITTDGLMYLYKNGKKQNTIILNVAYISYNTMSDTSCYFTFKPHQTLIGVLYTNYNGEGEKVMFDDLGFPKDNIDKKENNVFIKE